MAKKQKEYLDNPDECPYCGSENITEDYWNPLTRYQKLWCHNCHRGWFDVYQLVGYMPLKEPEKCANQSAMRDKRVDCKTCGKPSVCDIKESVVKRGEFVENCAKWTPKKEE